MAVTNVACPHCGKQALVTALMTRDNKGREIQRRIKKVVQNTRYKEMFSTTVHAACPSCGETFGVLFA